MHVLILSSVFILFGSFMLYVAFRNVFGVKEVPDEETEIDPESGEEVLSGEVIETRQLQS